MTADEFRKLVASGKIKPASAQKQAATKRRSLEKSSPPPAVVDIDGYMNLVEVRVQVAPGVEVIHGINPALHELINKLSNGQARESKDEGHDQDLNKQPDL